jgi:hypothetical protein
MAWYELKQALHLGAFDGKKGKDFRKGVHELSEKEENDPRFLKYVGAGLIIEAKKPGEPVVVDHSIAAKKLLDKLATRRQAQIAKNAPKEEAKAPEAPVEAPSKDEAPVEAPKEAPKGKSKNK